jgi:two-component system CheB/CheR fusion protein
MVKKTPGKNSRSDISPQEKRPLKSPPATVTTESEPVGPDAKRPDAVLRTRIVAMGASAGGLAAFEDFFSELPKAIPAIAFIVVQHLAPDHESNLALLIARHTRLQVRTAESGDLVRPRFVYVIPPNRVMTIEDGVLQLAKPLDDNARRSSIDAFFESLAKDQADRSVAVILSGTGSDGTQGVKAIKAAGGLIIAQDPETTQFDAMPSHVIQACLADFILAPSLMGPALLNFLQNGTRTSYSTAAEEISHESLNIICHLVRAATGHDFSQYKPNTIQRRVHRRMALHRDETTTTYIERLKSSPDEVSALFSDLLIRVTSFFRDSGPFAALTESVIAPLVRNKRPDEVIRVWVPGCATGEEPYSIAMLIAEQQEELGKTQDVKIFATDIDSSSIAKARLGVYTSDISEFVSDEQMAKYFVPEPNPGTGVSLHRVSKSIRDMVIFSEQDIVRDPPFSKLDLISCRNLLIYLGAVLQENLMRVFHYSLTRGGILFLGTSESTGNPENYFNALDRKSKIYLRQDASPATRSDNTARLLKSPERFKRSASMQVDHTRENADIPLREFTEQILLREFISCAALVTASGDILYIHGRSGQYLEPAEGDAAINNVLKMAREGLRNDLTIALSRAASTKANVKSTVQRVRTNGGFSPVRIWIQPAIPPVSDTRTEPLYLIALGPGTVVPHGLDDKPIDAENEPIDNSLLIRLKKQMRQKEEYLQVTTEELETSNEELRSSNEEMQSVNEELQSTNEELETSKEELQSLNEELSTVNSELEEKVTALSRVNSDMDNLLAGSGVATIFLDEGLQILRFTPSATEIINLIPADTGRPLQHIASNLLGYDQLVPDARTVLKTLEPMTIEVESRNSRWFELRLQPYKTIEGRIEGVVLTFIDITRTRKIQEKLRIHETCLHLAIESAPLCVFNQDSKLRYVWINDSSASIMDNGILGKTDEQWFHPETALKLTHIKKQVLERGVGRRISLRLVRENASYQVRLALEPLRDHTGKVIGIAGAAILEKSDSDQQAR